MVHFKKIEGHVSEDRPAIVRGMVYRLPSGVPVFANDGTQAIPGSVVTLENHETAFALLDQFHGVQRADAERSLFLREEIYAYLEDGQIEMVHAYCINTRNLPRGAKPLIDGDWRRSLQESPALFQRLTERQRAYIQKLGVSSNRDIVPIDLTLYRELMHLEIVIDKGRRLALTPLGQEILRFLS
jgi:hypothetical protein